MYVVFHRLPAEFFYCRTLEAITVHKELKAMFLRRIIVSNKSFQQLRPMTGFAEMLRQTVAKNKAVESATSGSVNRGVPSDIPIVGSQEELQPEWAALERRVLERKTAKIGK